jgi:hypothetical protein
LIHERRRREMRRGAVLLAVLAVGVLGTGGSAWADRPNPVPGTPSCHGLIIAAGAEGIGLGNLARQQGVGVIPMHDILFAPCLQ